MCMYNVGYYTDVYIKTYMLVDFIGSGYICVCLMFLIIIVLLCVFLVCVLRNIWHSLLIATGIFSSLPEPTSGPAGPGARME